MIAYFMNILTGLIEGIEAATGSLGHGFPMALGMALSSKIQNKKFKTYALLSDGSAMKEVFGKLLWLQNYK